MVDTILLPTFEIPTYITQTLAVIVLIITVYMLIKRYETRMVLIASGLLLCILSLSPMTAFDAFSTRMTSGALIQAICASMGFAYVMKYTKCDVQLVKAISGVLKGLGFFLIPAAVIVTFLINIAIPSAAGCAAAVGATLIPVLIAARIHPAIAGAAVLCGTIGSFLSPGLSHNPFIANMSNMTVVEFIAHHSMISISVGLIGAVGLSVVALVRKEYNVETVPTAGAAPTPAVETDKTNYLHATAPFIPLILLIVANTTTVFGKSMNVPAAMLIGSIYALIITFSNPSDLTKQFFNGMGSAYADILGIIIAAEVFSQGLISSGLVASFTNMLIQAPDVARWGGTVGPFLMGIITGSGDAAAYAFNNTITPIAADLGFTIPDLGMAAAITGALGRTMSPVAGVVIVCAGLAGVNPLELAKRTAPGMIVGVIFVALFML